MVAKYSLLLDHLMFQFINMSPALLTFCSPATPAEVLAVAAKLGYARHKGTIPKQAAQEFAQALEEYKRTVRRKFPTWAEHLELLLKLGYAKKSPEIESEEEHRA